MHCNIPGLYSRDTSSTPSPMYDNQNCLQTLSNVPWRPNNPSLRSTVVDNKKKEGQKLRREGREGVMDDLVVLNLGGSDESDSSEVLASVSGGRVSLLL